MTQYKFVHSCIRVLDLDAAIEFYKKALGLEVVRKKDFPAGKFTLVFMGNDQSDFQLELTYNYDREEPYQIGDGYSHIAVVVDDLKSSRERHKEMGYKVSDITSLSQGSSGFYFLTDPDGYDIEIIQR
ncbi:MAG: VOC family protein [Halanaerobium sp.]|nr:VOC family protein [Halanaerobium sp.]